MYSPVGVPSLMWPVMHHARVAMGSTRAQCHRLVDAYGLVEAEVFRQGQAPIEMGAFLSLFTQGRLNNQAGLQVCTEYHLTLLRKACSSEPACGAACMHLPSAVAPCTMHASVR